MTKFHFYIIVFLLALVLMQLNVFNLKFFWLGVSMLSLLASLVFIHNNLE